MDGIIVYADILAKWLEGFSVMWNVLNTNIIDYLDAIINNSHGTNVVLFSAVRELLVHSDFASYNLLSFIFGMFGISFGFFFGYTLIKWFFDLVS